jgi:hypothetical protein
MAFIDLNQKGAGIVRCDACQTSFSVDVDRINDLLEFSEQLLQEDAHGLLGKRIPKQARVECKVAYR